MIVRSCPPAGPDQLAVTARKARTDCKGIWIGLRRTYGASEQRRRSRSDQGFRAFDAFALAGAVHCLPQIVAPLRVQPVIGAVAEYARENERVAPVTERRSLHNSLTCLRCTPIAPASAACVRPIGRMNSSTRISSTVAGLRFVIGGGVPQSFREAPLRIAVNRIGQAGYVARSGRRIPRRAVWRVRSAAACPLSLPQDTCTKECRYGTIPARYSRGRR
jgi:hypothetical protein